jgi:hypothetical protein
MDDGGEGGRARSHGTDGGAGADKGGAAPPVPGKRTLIEQLAQGSAAQIRAAIGASPALGQEIQRYFAEGNTDPGLNAKLGQAFPGKSALPSPVSAASADKATTPKPDKTPTGAGAVLPHARGDTKVLSKGTFTWSLMPLTSFSPRFDADFLPDPTKVDGKNVSFGQTVVNHTGAVNSYPGGTTEQPDLNKPTYAPFEEATKKMRMDHHPEDENDPYYGAEWDQAKLTWKRETVDWHPGSSSKKDGIAISAAMWDAPDREGYAREGKGDVSSEFETVAVVLETREPLGAIKWGFSIKDEPEAPMVLTGATAADCTEAPSAEWGAAMDKFYEGKFDTILDDYEIGKADLKADHKTKLDTLATKLKGNAALKAQCGGACDLTGDEAFNKALSLKRAQGARDYLVAKGVPAGQLDDVQSYSNDWARVEAEQGKSEGKNRRVQIWVR